MSAVGIQDLFLSIEMVPYGILSYYPTELFWSSKQILTSNVIFKLYKKDVIVLLSLGVHRMYQQIRTRCSKRMISISALYQPNPNTRADFVTGQGDVWPSKGETNTGMDRRGNTSGTFLDWGWGKIVPALQSPPNLHQVSGIKGSISDLAFNVWLNHPGQRASWHD